MRRRVIRRDYFKANDSLLSSTICMVANCIRPSSGQTHCACVRCSETVTELGIDAISDHGHGNDVNVNREPKAMRFSWNQNTMCGGLFCVQPQKQN